MLLHFLSRLWVLVHNGDLIVWQWIVGMARQESFLMHTMSNFFFKDGADLRMESFSCKQSLHTLSLGANGFTFLTTSHLMLKSMFLFFNFQTWSLSVGEVLLCSNLKDDLYKLNLVLNSFSVSPIYVSWLFEVLSVTIAFYTTHLVRHLPLSGQEFFADSYIVCYLELTLSFYAVAVSDGCYCRLSV